MSFHSSLSRTARLLALAALLALTLSLFSCSGGYRGVDGLFELSNGVLLKVFERDGTPCEQGYTLEKGRLAALPAVEKELTVPYFDEETGKKCEQTLRFTGFDDHGKILYPVRYSLHEQYELTLLKSGLYVLQLDDAGAVYLFDTAANRVTAALGEGLTEAVSVSPDGSVLLLRRFADAEKTAWTYSFYDENGTKLGDYVNRANDKAEFISWADNTRAYFSEATRSMTSIATVCSPDGKTEIVARASEIGQDWTSAAGTFLFYKSENSVMFHDLATGGHHSVYNNQCHALKFAHASPSGKMALTSVIVAGDTGALVVDEVPGGVFGTGADEPGVVLFGFTEKGKYTERTVFQSTLDDREIGKYFWISGDTAMICPVADGTGDYVSHLVTLK